MKFLISFIYLLVLYGKLVITLKLPDSWTKCRVPVSQDFKRNKCLEKAITDAIISIGNIGESSLNLPSVDPLLVKKMSVGSYNPESPVYLQINLKNIKITGTTSVNIKSVSGKLSSPKDWVMRTIGDYDKLELRGEYNMKGRLLILPTDGEGRFNMTFVNIKSDSYIWGQPEIKDGKEYLKITNNSMSLKTDRFYINFNRFLNADDQLVKNFNNILNDNWEILYEELKPDMEKELGTIFTKITKKVLERIPFNEIFIVDNNI